MMKRLMLLLSVSFVFAGCLKIKKEEYKVEIPKFEPTQIKSDPSLLDFRLFVFFCDTDKATCEEVEKGLRAAEKDIDQIRTISVKISRKKSHFDLQTKTYVVNATDSIPDIVKFMNATFYDLMASEVLVRQEEVRKKFDGLSSCSLESFKECAEGFSKLLAVPANDDHRFIRVIVDKEKRKLRADMGMLVNFRDSQNEMDLFLSQQVGLVAKAHEIDSARKGLIHLLKIKDIQASSIDIEHYAKGIQTLGEAWTSTPGIAFKPETTLYISYKNSPPWNLIGEAWFVSVKWNSTTAEMGNYLKTEFDKIK